MKYQKIYDALQTGGDRIDLDQSGWRANSSDNWIAGQRPLWLVAEVPIDSRAYHESHTRRAFQNQREMAEYLEDLLSRKEAAV